MQQSERGRRTLGPTALERLVADLRATMDQRRPATVVCIECYRDGGCLEHSRPEEER